ncbi:MAG: serine hydrolase domain-containing protein [Fimbriimonadales bacterium]
MKAPIVLVSAAVLVASSFADKVDSFVGEQMKLHHVPGVTVAAIQGGKVLKAKGYGLASLELNSRANRETVYEIGSVTKQFTAAAIMMLVEAAKVGLDVGVRRYLPEAPEKWEGVTVRHLLTHTSGIFSYTNVVPFVALAKRDYTQDQILRMVSDLKLNFTPGGTFEYSNTNYYLLGMIVERVSGDRYWTFMENRIFGPLGMAHTRNGDPKTVIENRASGYFWNGKVWLNMAPLTPTAGWAAGSLVSTVDDMAKWDAALYTEKLLKTESLKQMFTPAKLKDGKDADMGYGFGWANMESNGHPHAAHGGGTAGFSSNISRFPKDNLTVVVLTNLAGFDAGAVAKGIAEFYVPDLRAKPIEDKDPKTTAFIRRVVDEIIDGTISKELFTSEAQGVIFQRLTEARLFLATLGLLKSMALLKDKSVANERTLQYRTEFEKGGLVLNVVMTKDHKIAAISFTS